MTRFHWVKPTPEQIADAQELADKLGLQPYWHGDALFVGEPDPEPAIPVPHSVTVRQARLALLGAGLLSTVDAALAAMPGVQGEAARIEWEYALEINRDSPMINALAPIMGLTAEQIDQLFIAAAAI